MTAPRPSQGNHLALRVDLVPHRVGSPNVLEAPFDGIVTEYDVAVGELVEPQHQLFTITDMSSVWVLADLYERDLASVRSDLDVTVTVEAYPDRTFRGHVTYVSDLIDPATRTAKVRSVVPNPDGALKLAMFAKVAVPTGGQSEAVTVAANAVQQVDGQAVVFVRLTPTRFETRPVVTRDGAGAVVEVVSGLAPGEWVVSSGSFYLKTPLLRERIGGEH